MQKPDAPNPERRSDAALLCLFIGFGLMGLAWLLGVGGTLTAVFSGKDPPALAGGTAALLLLPGVAVIGVLFMLVGAIWLVVRVIADQREDHSKDRYSRNVER